MTGWEQNSAPSAFMRADVEEASARLLRIIDEENADVLVGYDWHGGYGHPDHIMVHRVVHAAAAQRPGVALWEATMNRDRVRQRMQAAFDAGFMKEADKWDVDGPADDGNPFGSLESEISLMVDVRAHAARKKESVKCHASQVTDSSFFLSMPDDAFVDAFGWEWFIKPGDASPMREGFIV
jgi:LmbE family N-acetylglucosaminyl deacetylase